MNLVVYAQYYRCKTADRQLEVDECLRRNLNHPGISKVVLFKESDAPPLPEASVPLEVVESDERITDAEWFRWVKRQGTGIGLLLNAEAELPDSLHPSLSPDEDAVMGFSLWTRSQQCPVGVMINQQAIEQGVHQLRHANNGRMEQAI
jgi:hypothetical protein